MTGVFEVLALVSFALWVLVIGAVLLVWFTKGRTMMRDAKNQRAGAEEMLKRLAS